MTESRIADIYDPIIGSWTPVPLSGPPAPRERLPNNTMHLPDEERERIRRQHGEAMLADVEAVAHGLLHGRDIPREREAAENCRLMYPHEYTFRCALISSGPEIGDTPAFDRLRSEVNSLSERLASAECSVLLDFNRSHAVVRTSRALADEEVGAFKAVFAAFRQKTADAPQREPLARRRSMVLFVARHARQPLSEIEALDDDKLGAMVSELAAMLEREPPPAPMPTLSEDDARELAWLRDLYSRAHLKPALLSNTTGQRWAIVPLDDVRGGQQSAEHLLPPPPRSSPEADGPPNGSERYRHPEDGRGTGARVDDPEPPSGPGDSIVGIGFDSGLLVPVSPAEVEAVKPRGRGRR